MSELPVLGFTIWYSIKHVEISQPDLSDMVTECGFTDIDIPQPTEQKSLGRAIRAWIKDRDGFRLSEEPETSGKRKNAKRELIRSINNRKTTHHCFALVEEDVDWENLGLHHATQARILMEKLDPAKRSRRTPRLLCTTEASGVEAIEEAVQLTEELAPHWETYREMLQNDDVSTLVTQLILRIPNIMLVKDAGGVYFVPVSSEPIMRNVQRLIEMLPYEGERRPYLVAIPQIDESRARKELAYAAQRGFEQRLTALMKKLQDLKAKAKNVKHETIAEKLLEYQQIKTEIAAYHDLLGLQQEDLLKKLNQLSDDARALLTGGGDDDE